MNKRIGAEAAATSDNEISRQSVEVLNAIYKSLGDESKVEVQTLVSGKGEKAETLFFISVTESTFSAPLTIKTIDSSNTILKFDRCIFESEVQFKDLNLKAVIFFGCALNNGFAMKDSTFETFEIGKSHFPKGAAAPLKSTICDCSIKSLEIMDVEGLQDQFLVLTRNSIDFFFIDSICQLALYDCTFNSFSCLAHRGTIFTNSNIKIFEEICIEDDISVIGGFGERHLSRNVPATFYKLIAIKDEAGKEIDYAIATLEVPTDAKVASVGRKSRVDKVIVKEIEGLGGTMYSVGHSFLSFRVGLIYEKGKKVEVQDFDDNIFKQCSRGIHCYENKEDVAKLIETLAKKGRLRI